MDDVEIESEDNNDLSENIDVMESEVDTLTNKSATKDSVLNDKPKLIRLPLSRVKTIMKMDPDCYIISQDALMLVTKATEFFLEGLAKESVKYTLAVKRKTILKKDLNTAIDQIPNLCFLDGILDQL